MKDDTKNKPHYVAELIGIRITEEDRVEGLSWDSRSMYTTMSFLFTDAASFKRKFATCVCAGCPEDHRLNAEDFDVLADYGSVLRVMFMGSPMSTILPARLMPASKKELDKFYKAKIKLWRFEYFFSVKKCIPDVHDDLVDMFN